MPIALNRLLGPLLKGFHYSQILSSSQHLATSSAHQLAEIPAFGKEEKYLLQGGRMLGTINAATEH